jgi:hypothetical protein
MKIQIPKKVTIGKKRYKVTRVHSLKTGHVGRIHYKSREIDVARNYITNLFNRVVHRLPLSEQRENYLHEVVHGILHDMKRHDVNNEAFVNAFCRRLYVILRGK